MAIDALQALTPTGLLPDSGAAKRKGAASSGFDNVLQSARQGDQPAAVKAQQAAAELLRMEMMQSTLALAGEPEEGAPSAMRALTALICGAAGKGQPARNPQAATELPPPLATGEASPQQNGIGETAAEFLGTPYRFGGEGADGIDCSSFVQQVFREHQIALPRTAREQSRVGTEVSQGDLKKGDLVFFHTYASYPSHVGIYLGDGKMIHASSGKGEVTVSDMNSEYYRSRFMGAKRIA